MSLQAVREKWQRAVFEWGKTDCIMSVCDYVRDVTGIDPAGELRGTYHDEATARAIYEQYGGVAGLCSYAMKEAGFEEGEASEGRPVVCDLCGVQVAGISFGRVVGFMAPRGMIEIKATVLKAWII